MSYTVRPLTDHEHEPFQRVANAAFGSPYKEIYAQEARTRLAGNRMFGGFVDTQLVSTSQSLPLQVTLPGGSEAALAWIFAVATLPSHRRRGLMTRVVETQLLALREEGFFFAALAAHSGWYRRFGFGVSGSHAELNIASGHSLRTTSDHNGAVQFVDAVTAVGELPDFHKKYRSTRPGEISRDPGWWRRATRLDEQHVLVRSDSRHTNSDCSDVDAWASYRVTSTFEGTHSRTVVEVSDFLAIDERSRHRLWEVVLGFDFADSVSVRSLPLDDVIFQLARDPWEVNTRVRPHPWLRVLDVQTAFTSRRFAQSVDVVDVTVAVSDSLIKANEDVFRIVVDEEGAATCERSTAQADISIDISDLSAAILGGNKLSQLQKIGLLGEHRRGAVDALDAALISKQTPHCSLFLV